MKMNKFKGFVKNISIISISLLIISSIIYFFAPKIMISPAFPIILIFMYLTTILIFKLLAKSMENRLSKFANAYMLVNFGKLVIFSIIIVVYAVLNKEDAISFMLTFFIYYFIFTIFEVFALLRLKS